MIVSAMQLSSVIFYAVAAALGVIAVVAFCVAAFRKKRKRNAGDVLYLIFGSFVFIAATLLCAFATLNHFGFLGFEAQSVGSGKFTELALYTSGKRLIAVPYIGRLAGIFASLGLYGVIATAAVVVLMLVSLITLGAKTKRKMPTPAGAPAQPDKPVPADREDETPAESETMSGLHVHKDIFGEPDRIEYEPADEEDSEEQIGEEMPTYDEQPTDEDELAPVDEDTAHDIVDEIDRLVEGTPSKSGEEPIGDKLRKAIEEGYDLMDAFDGGDEQTYEERQTDEADEEYFAEQPTDEEQPTEEAWEEEQPTDEISAEQEEQPEDDEGSLDGWAYEQDGEVAEQEEDEPYEAAYEPPYEPPAAADTKSDEPKVRPRETVRAPVYERVAPSDIQVRVRTIVRRPAARSVDEIERRAEEILEPKAQEKPAEKKQAPEKQQPTPKKQPTEKAQASPKKPTTQKKSPAPEQKKATPAPEQKPTAQKTAPPEKEVEAQSSGLPLTRRYIILNRRSAATLFNEYLQSKHESEKAELTDRISTIIIK